MDKPTPRIDGSMLSQFPNRTVRLIGRVEQLKPNYTVSLYTPSLDSSSTERYDVTYSPDITFEQGVWYDVIARVTDELLVRAIDVTPLNFGPDINEQALAGLIKFTHKVPELFYQTEDW